MVYAHRSQNEPVILECLIEAYPQGVHFWEHDRGKYFNPNVFDYLGLMMIIQMIVINTFKMISIDFVHKIKLKY